MTVSTRRGFLGATGAALGALSLSRPATATTHPAPSPYRWIGPGDNQYKALCKGTNLRWSGRPQRIALPETAEDVAEELRHILAQGLRPAAKSGGHCYEDLVLNDEITAIIDMSAINMVQWDPEMGAFAIGAGAQLGAVYQLLYKQWGVYVPAGNCPTVAAGGHIAGGGYGCQNRRDGLVVDHLHAVEVVQVDAAGEVQILRASRDPNDPHHDLWWAYTGGGGGNFGIAVRYWLRSPGSNGRRPETALPTPPANVWLNTVAWPWAQLDEAKFTRLMQNHGAWHEANSAPGSKGANLFSQLKTWHRANGAITMDTLVNVDNAEAEQLCLDYIAALSKGVGTPVVQQHRQVPWMQSTTWSGFTGPDSTRRFDGKSAYLRASWTPEMISAAWTGLNDPDLPPGASLLMIASYGGAVNRVAPSATATAQRDSIIKFQVVSIWDDAENDAAHIAWTRSTYAGMFVSTGKVPVPNAVTDGAFVNYCDTDLDDPAWNLSGLTSGDLYYKENLKRLQDIRKKYDPKQVFRHAQSI